MGGYKFQSPEGGSLGLQALTKERVVPYVPFQSPEGGSLGLQVACAVMGIEPSSSFSPPKGAA